MDPIDTIVTMDDEGLEIADGHIAIRDGIIEAVGPGRAGPEWDDAPHVSCRGAVAIPGLVNTHHHLFQAVSRCAPPTQSVGLAAWLAQLYPTWATITPDVVYAGALTGLAELALSGCTTSVDHLFAFPPGGGPASDYLDAVASAAELLGMRIHLVRGTVDPDPDAGGGVSASLREDPDRALREMELAIDRYHVPGPGSMRMVALGADALSPMGEPLMREVAGLSRRRGVLRHTHCSQVEDEVDYCLSQFGCRPVERLMDLGWLDEQAWVAHAIHVEGRELDRLAATGAGVAHCPTSNMRLGVGIAPVMGYLAAGMRVGLGVDGSASNDGSNLLGEARQALLAARLRDPDHLLDARSALRMATRLGASVLHRPDLGSLCPGLRADIAVYRLRGVAAAGSANDPVAALVMGWPPRAEHVLVDGAWVVRDGELLTASESWAAGILASVKRGSGVQSAG